MKVNIVGLKSCLKGWFYISDMLSHLLGVRWQHWYHSHICSLVVSKVKKKKKISLPLSSSTESIPEHCYIFRNESWLQSRTFSFINYLLRHLSLIEKQRVEENTGIESASSFIDLDKWKRATGDCLLEWTWREAAKIKTCCNRRWNGASYGIEMWTVVV